MPKFGEHNSALGSNDDPINATDDREARSTLITKYKSNFLDIKTMLPKKRTYVTWTIKNIELLTAW